MFVANNPSTPVHTNVNFANIKINIASRRSGSNTIGCFIRFLKALITAIEKLDAYLFK